MPTTVLMRTHYPELTYADSTRRASNRQAGHRLSDRSQLVPVFYCHPHWKTGTSKFYRFFILSISGAHCTLLIYSVLTSRSTAFLLLPPPPPTLVLFSITLYSTVRIINLKSEYNHLNHSGTPLMPLTPSSIFIYVATILFLSVVNPHK